MRKIILGLIVMIAMVGTAVASPEYIFIYKDGTTTFAPNPVVLKNDGSNNLLDAYFNSYYDTTLGLTHTLQATITAVDGANLASGEITVKAKEKDVGASEASAISDGTSSSVTCQLFWDQDDDGNAISSPVTGDTIDITIISTGPANRVYSITLSDSCPSFTTPGYTDLGLENIGGVNVPEFPTIALPVAAILGIVFIFQRRKEE